MGQRREAPPATAGSSLASRLAKARRRSFVGRAGELDLFRDALSADPPPFAVLHLHGPGGVGKSTLLRRFEEEARTAGATPVLLDGRTMEPSPTGLRAALADVLGSDDPADVETALHDVPRPVLMLDGYEHLTGVDGWLRQTFVPRLPADAIVVLAGRDRPATGWRSDPGWHDLLRVIALRDLPPDDARRLLTARGVPEEQHDEALAFAHGHPLALVLVADLLPQPDARLDLPAAGGAPDVVGHLLDRFLDRVPGTAHRHALAVAARAGVATEALLRDTVDGAPAGELFRWLRGLSFTEPVAGGLALHDLVREVLDAELRWRDPDRHADVHRRVAVHLRRRVATATGPAKQRAMIEMLELYRFSPVANRFFDWDATDDKWMQPATADDHAAIVAMTRRHEGDASAAVAEYWLGRQPDAFRVFRTAGADGPTGFIAHLRLGDAPGEEVEVDPVAAAVWDHVRRDAPMRAGEQLLLLRFWVDAETYQDVATHHLVSTAAALAWLTTPRLAWSVVVLADPAFWEPIFAFIDFEQPSDLEVAAGDDHTVGMFTRDWRTGSVVDWLELLTERQLSAAPTPEQLPEPTGRQLLVLAQPTFRSAVREALRSFTRPDVLADSPLVRSRLVVEHQRQDEPPAAALQRLLTEAVDALAADPRDERLQRTVDLTYLHPAPTQEAAAERLDLPFSTFRRHLTAGVDRVVDWCWERELYGPPRG